MNSLLICGQQTVHVDKEALLALTQESLEKASSIQRIEGAATELYKALQAGRDRGMKLSCYSVKECNLTLHKIWLRPWKGWMSIELTIHISASASLTICRYCLRLRHVSVYCNACHTTLTHFSVQDASR